MADQYVFVASGDACEICASLNGQVATEPMELPHDNCQCQVIPLSDDDCPTYSFSASSRRYGPGGESFAIEVEITVTCCDGSEISESKEIDMGNEAALGDSEFDAIDAAVDYEASALATQCPPDPNIA